MRHLCNLLFLAGGIVLAACATQSFPPDKAPEYVTTRDPTPFYLKSPTQTGEEPDASLKGQTRMKLLRKKTGYSLVLLEDSRKGYIANAYITPAPPGSDTRPFGSSTENDSPAKRKKPSLVTPAPSPEPAPASETPATETIAPPANAPGPPDLNSPAGEVPSPTPTPEASPEKPKFRL
jgi:hypothetical protein